MVELGAGAGGFNDPLEHGFAGDAAEDFAGEPRGGEAGGDDGEGGKFGHNLGGAKWDAGCDGGLAREREIGYYLVVAV